MKALYFENKLAKVILLKALLRLSKRAPFLPGSPLRFAPIPEPELPNPRWLKIRNIACGLCGTDLHFIFMDMDPKSFCAAMPGIERKFLGHEVVGEVIEVGDEVDDFEIGDRVVMRIDWPSCAQLEIAPPCPQCAQGRYMACEKIGLAQLPTPNTGGGFAPRMIMHRSQAYKVPEALSTEEALLIEPLASALHGVLKAPPPAKEPVLIVGGGTIGLLCAAVLHALYPETPVYGLARYPFQASLFEALHARPILEDSGIYAKMAQLSRARHIQGYFNNEILLGGFARIYDCIGNDKTLNNALRWCKAQGEVVLIGINFKPGRIDYSPIWAQEVTLKGINCHATEADGRTSFDIATELLLKKRFDAKLFLSHRFPLSQYPKAIHTFLNKKDSHATKIVLDPNA